MDTNEEIDQQAMREIEKARFTVKESIRILKTRVPPHPMRIQKLEETYETLTGIQSVMLMTARS